jgi:hypothetical protein
LNRAAGRLLPTLIVATVVFQLTCADGARAGLLSDFEDGTAQGWTPENGAVLTPTMAEASTGLWSLRVDRVGGGFHFGTLRHDGLDHMAQWIGNERFAFDYKIGSFTTFLQARAAYNPNAGGATTESSGEMPDPNIHLDADGQWHTFEWSYPTTGTRAVNPAAPYFIEWIITNSSGDGTFWIDNIRTLPAIPEPATCGLAAAAALGLFVVRRKRG